jgi:lipopolysaccharide heptosyltransferase I
MSTTLSTGTDSPRRILIIKPSSLGDVVHALPVLAALRAAHPGAHIAWLVGLAFAPLLEGHPMIDEVIRFDRRRYGRMLQSPRIFGEFLRFAWGLRKRRFDLVIDLQGLFRSGFLAYVTGARRRIGFASAREFAPMFYSRRVRYRDHDSHAVAKNVDVTRALGLQIETPEFPLGISDEERAAARQTLETAAQRPLNKFTAIIPGARWQTKRWLPERIAGVIDRLHDDGYPPGVLLGAPGDRAFTDEIVASTKSQPIDLVGKTSLRELAAMLALTDMVICHDSGPMHIAAALNKPIVALFGPTNPGRTGPYCDTARIVALPLDCIPCYRRQCPLRHHDCMQKLDVETVLRHVRETRPLDAARDDQSAPATAQPADPHAPAGSRPL